MRKLWIPGAKGLVGSALLEMSKGIGTGREIDISDFHSVNAFVEKQGITHIVNCAAFSLVDLAETQREEAFKANVLGPENLAKISRKKGIRLIHLSTDYLFSGEIRRPLTEEDPTNPLNYYGETKLEGERRVLQEDITACVIRTSWVFGNGGKNFVGKVLQMLQTQKEIRLTDDQWGRPTYVNDLCQIILNMFDRKGLYQFANSGVTTKYAFGLKMRELALKYCFPVVTEAIIPAPGSSFPSPCKRPLYSAFDTTKIERELNLQIRPWETALEEFLCMNARSTASL
jgi:dTDP-4-dehydrorhamnose reductase